MPAGPAGPAVLPSCRTSPRTHPRVPERGDRVQQRPRPGQLRRLPEHQRGPAPGRGVLGHRDDVVRRDAQQPGRGRARVARGRRGEHHDRLRPVPPRQAQQPPQHRGHVRAEHPAVGVRLVEHHHPQPAQQAQPATVPGQQREVQEVGVGQHHVGVLGDPAPRGGVGVPVARRHPHVADLRGGQQALQPGELVGRERLGGGQVQHRAAAQAGFAHGGERRQPERQRLARARRGGQHGVPPGTHRVGGGHLVPPRSLDAELAVAGDQLGVRPGGPVGGLSLARRQVLDVGGAVRPPSAREQHVQQRVRGHPTIVPPAGVSAATPAPKSDWTRCHPIGLACSWLVRPSTQETGDRGRTRGVD